MPKVQDIVLFQKWMFLELKPVRIMAKEEKDLLIKDLCARLPYGVVCSIYRIDDCGVGWRDETLTGYFNNGISYEFYFGEEPISIDDISKIKPYLRPMSSMTEEEKELSWWYQRDAKCDNFILYMSRYVEWLDSKHFDWRTDGNGKTMIEKGLALEAPEGMYNN